MTPNSNNNPNTNNTKNPNTTTACGLTKLWTLWTF